MTELKQIHRALKRLESSIPHANARLRDVRIRKIERLRKRHNDLTTPVAIS